MALRIGFGALGAALLVAGCTGGPRIETRADAPPGTFEAAGLVAISDLDMAATGYADGKLRQIPGRRDQLSVLRGFDRPTPQAAAVLASNSVAGWPGALALSADGRFGYVIETQGEIDDAVSQVADPYSGSPGRKLSAFDLSDLAAPRPIGSVDVCGDPAAIDIHPSGAFAVVGCRDALRPLAIVPLVEGAPLEPRPLALSIPDALMTEKHPGVSFARLSPNGRIWAANIANRGIVFYELVFGPNGAPEAANPIGAPVVPARGWLSMARWALDGRHLLTADTAWGPGQLGAVLNGPGRIVSIAFDAGGDHRIVSEAQVSLSPEGFELDPAGRLLAVANMERTYLPDHLPFSLFGRRKQASLSLVSFDPQSGVLTTVDGPIAFDAVLPEDVAFDDAGDTIAAVSYQERSATPQAGFVALFEVDRSGPAPRLAPTGVRWALPRGAHDLAVVRADTPN